MIKPSKQIFVYDPEDDMWTELAPMNDARFDPGEIMNEGQRERERERERERVKNRVRKM